jgi:hypothetical protein
MIGERLVFLLEIASSGRVYREAGNWRRIWKDPHK